jgi:hypothetical protein
MHRLGKQQHGADITLQRTLSGSAYATTCPTHEAAWPRALSPSSQLLLLDLVEPALCLPDFLCSWISVGEAVALEDQGGDGARRLATAGDAFEKDKI